MTKILCIQHESNCGPGRFERWWTEAGAEVAVVHGPTDPVPADLAGVDALVVLGGSMNANSDGEHLWLGPTKARIREAIAGDVPLLGICLGHQLTAVALAGRVETAARLTLGLTPFLRTDAGREDPLFGLLVDPVLTVNYNGDEVAQLPEGAVALAHTPDGQLAAARYARRAWGIQSHPEVTAAGFAEWTSDKPADQRPQVRVDVDDLARAVAESEDAIAAMWKPVAMAFLAQLS